MKQNVARATLAALLLLAGVALAGEGAPAPITLATLLDDMTNLRKLAEFPDPPYTVAQFSSYDRASKSPTQNWFANNDCGQFLRVEERDGRKESVMMDAQGPGVIVRIWSANPNGVLRFYIDGAAQPAMEAPMRDILGGKIPGMPAPIACETSKGFSLYLPIPYAKSCKVTCDAGAKVYYHVGYRTYPAGTNVQSFTVDQVTALYPNLHEVAGRLSQPSQERPLLAPFKKDFEKTVAAGATEELATWDAHTALSHFKINWMPTGARDEPSLRAVVLQITIDGEKTVEAPLGDFFGTGPGVNAYESWPLSVGGDGTLVSRWFMPCKRKGEIKVLNYNKEPVLLKGAIESSICNWSPRAMLFHAKWRIAHDVPTEPKQDWNYLTATGKGVFVGVAFSIDNPVKAWWGEGDEKIYIDGETFPSHFGTGTEDYYGYAWCSNMLFTHAYHNQTRCDGPGNFGRTSVNRFDILDRIPFTKDFRFDMELWHWKKCNVNMAVIDYWYAFPGATDTFAAPSPNDVTLREPPVLKVEKVAGAIEGEDMRVIEKVGDLETQEWNNTSGGKQLWWKGGHKPGDRIVLGFNVAEAGRYRVFGRFLKAIDYGIAQFAINDQKAGDPIDFFHEGVDVTNEIELGAFDLKQGENTLTVTCTGANPLAAKSYMVGIDYLLLKPAK